MPVISCPKCPTKLRVADGATGNVKCPKCTTVFPVVAPAPSAAFEVVDDAPAPAPSRPAAAARPAAKPAAPAPAKDDFDFDDKPKKKKRADDNDDDDDDRPKKKKRADDDDDDDDDDRPRSKSKRRRDDDDDDEDDRPRKKKKGRRYDDDDDDDEEDYRPRNKGGNGFAHAKTGMLLLNISFWLYMASLAIITLGIFLAWVGAFDGSSSSRSSSSSRGSISSDDDFRGGSSSSSMDTLIKLPGLLGMANWVVALVGFSFCIAGPKRARGMAITATALSGAHLLFAGITFNNLGGGMFGQIGAGMSSPSWLFWSSMFPFLDALLPALFYASKFINGDFIFAVLAGGCELARLIFALLLIKELATAAKDYDSAEKAQLGVLASAIISGVAAGLVLLVVILLDAGITKSINGLANIATGTLLLVYGGFTGMTVLPIIASGGARRALARRARRG